MYPVLPCALLHTVWTNNRECCYMCYDTAPQMKTDTAAQTKLNNKIAKAIADKAITLQKP